MQPHFCDHHTCSPDKNYQSGTEIGKRDLPLLVQSTNDLVRLLCDKHETQMTGDIMRDPIDVYMNTLVPMVVEQTARGERAYDIFSRLLKNVSYLYPARFMTVCRR